MAKQKVMDRIRILRAVRCIGQTELAGKVDVSPAYINQIERGTRPGSEEVLARIAKALGVTASKLVDQTLRIGWK